MNERIKQLAEQADIYINKSNCVESGNGTEIIGWHIEKLAELIVRKCADIGQQYADGNYEVPNQILEHFGVEE